MNKIELFSLRNNLYRLTKGSWLSNIKSDLIKSVRQKNPSISLSELVRFFSQIEQPYQNRRLSLDAPDPVEFEE